jgi:CO dehydrogenase/acetyl-CoA synthase beta subunit
MNCYGSGPWGPPPYGGTPPSPYPGYIPIPSGMDPDKAMEFYDKMERFAEKLAEKEKKKAEEAKKKESEKKKDTPKQPMFSGLQVFLMLMAFGLPVGGANLLFMNAMLNLLKEHLLK